VFGFLSLTHTLSVPFFIHTKNSVGEIMKRALLCIALLLSAVIAWCQPAWNEDVVVRDGQDLHYFGNPVCDSYGNVLSAWVKTSGNKYAIIAALSQPEGALIWDNPLIIKECEAPVTDINLLATTDNCFIISWLEANDNLGYQVLMQKFSSSGVPLWGTGISVVADRIVTTYIYKIVANDIGGAYVFYQEEGENLLLGRCYNAAGSEIWGANAPYIITEDGMIFSGIATCANYGVALHYKCASTATNYVEGYTYFGFRQWQHSYPYEPGESNFPHHLFVTADHRVYDLVKSIGTNQSLKVRILYSGSSLINPPAELVLSETTDTNIDYDVILSGSDCEVVFQKTIGSINEIRYFTAWGTNLQIYPPGGVLLGTHNGSVRDLKICMDFPNKYCSWIEEDLNSEVLRVNKVDNQTEAAWGENGISLFNGPGTIGNYSIIASGTQLNAMYKVDEATHTKLYKQVVSPNGTLVYASGGQTLSSSLAGHAHSLATHIMGDRVLVFYHDINSEGKHALFYQIISSAGYQVLPQPVQLGSYTYQQDYVTSSNSSGNVALIFNDGGLYFQEISYWGDFCYSDPGILISNATTTKAKLSYYNGGYYLGWMENTANSYRVMGQLIRNSAKQWGYYGKELVGFEAYNSCYMTASEGPYFTWTRQLSGTSSESIQCILVDDNGDPQPGWATTGETIYINPDDHASRPFYAQLSGDDLILVLGGFEPSSTLAIKVTPQHLLPWGSTGLLLGDNTVTLVKCEPRVDGFGILMKGYLNNNSILLYQSVDYNGNLFYEAPGLILYTASDMNNISSVSLESFANGGMVAIWCRESNSLPDKLFYQTISTLGGLVESEPQSLCTNYGSQRYPVTASKNNEAMVVWELHSPYYVMEYSNPFRGLFAQKLSGINASSIQEHELVESPLAIHAAYPNPFSASVTIAWQQKSNEPVNICVYNIKGQLVKKFLSVQQGKGEHSVIWNGENTQGKRVGSGIYFIRVQNSKDTQIRKIVKL
jgi:hypothetical protein